MKNKPDPNQFLPSGAANRTGGGGFPNSEAPGPAAKRDGALRATPPLMSGLLMLGLLGGAVFLLPSASQAAEFSVGISVRIGPPPLPIYTQPVCPGPDYIWTPGYWAYDPDYGYFWVPGTWMMAPILGYYWTPGYWAWGENAFFWHAGYWGPHVGFYGGIDYGFGYPGVGFVGGEWRSRTFFYNRSVNNINLTRVTNVYDRRVSSNFAANHVSYNGGEGGIRIRPGREELAAEHDRHVAATSMQRQHEMTAHNDRSQFVSQNHGRPAVAATGRPSEFRGQGVVPANRAGGMVNPSGYRGNQASGYQGGQHGSPSIYSNGRKPNPAGAGTPPFSPPHPNPPGSNSHGARQQGAAAGQYQGTPSEHQAGPPSGQYRAAPQRQEGPTPGQFRAAPQSQPGQYRGAPQPRPQAPSVGQYHDGQPHNDAARGPAPNRETVPRQPLPQPSGEGRDRHELGPHR